MTQESSFIKYIKSAKLGQYAVPSTSKYTIAPAPIDWGDLSPNDIALAEKNGWTPEEARKRLGYPDPLNLGQKIQRNLGILSDFLAPAKQTMPNEAPRFRNIGDIAGVTGNAAFAAAPGFGIPIKSAGLTAKIAVPAIAKSGVVQKVGKKILQAADIGDIVTNPPAWKGGVQSLAKKGTAKLTEKQIAEKFAAVKPATGTVKPPVETKIPQTPPAGQPPKPPVPPVVEGVTPPYNPEEVRASMLIKMKQIIEANNPISALYKKRLSQRTALIAEEGQQAAKEALDNGATFQEAELIAASKRKVGKLAIPKEFDEIVRPEFTPQEKDYMFQLSNEFGQKSKVARFTADRVSNEILDKKILSGMPYKLTDGEINDLKAVLGDDLAQTLIDATSPPTGSIKFTSTGEIDPKQFDYLDSLPTYGIQERMGTIGQSTAGNKFTYNPTGQLEFQKSSQQLNIEAEAYVAHHITDMRSPAELEYVTTKVNLSSQFAKRQITEDQYKLSLASAKQKYLGTNPPDPVRFDYLDNISTGNVQYSLGDAPRSQAEWDYVNTQITLKGLLAKKVLTQEEFDLQMAIARERFAPYVFERPIEEAMKDFPTIPADSKVELVKILKEVGMSPIDIGNFIRANMSSVDFSFWRQQAPLILNHKRDFLHANIEAWHGMWDKNAAKASWDNIINDPLYKVYQEVGADFLRPYELTAGELAGKGVEEYGYTTAQRFIPRITAEIPWVKVSQRGFVTGTNAHNWAIFKQHYSDLLRYEQRTAAKELQPAFGQPKLLASLDMKKEMSDMSKLLGDLSGRASLGKGATILPALSGLLFAPRLLLGRLLSPRHLFSTNPRIRAEAYKDLFTFVGGIGTILAAGKAMRIWDVETNPTSSDFLKIRIGNTRIDPWGGYIQYAIFTNRIIAGIFGGRAKSSETGERYKLDPIQTGVSFLRGKTSPIASFALDLATRRNFLGEDVDLKNLDQWANRIAPMSAMSIFEAYKDDPVTAITTAVPTFLGAGAQTFGVSTELWHQWEDAGDFKVYSSLPLNDDVAKAQGKQTRTTYRREHPTTEAKLFIAGQITSLSTLTAVSQVVSILKQNKLDATKIKGIEEFVKAQKKKRELGLKVQPDSKVNDLINRLNISIK